MSAGGKKSLTVLFRSSLLFGQLTFTVAAVAQSAPRPDAWNMQLVGASQNKGQADIGPYSKMSPWPNPDGEYFYSGCYDPAPLDPNFEGFALQDTDAEGRYRFKTIKPGAYPATADWMRPPHLHFEVTGKINRLITQMYFENDPYNKTDPFLNSAGRTELLITKLLDPSADFEPQSKTVMFDIVLIDG